MKNPEEKYEEKYLEYLDALRETGSLTCLGQGRGRRGFILLDENFWGTTWKRGRTKMNECGKEMLEKKTTPSTGGLEATQELKDYLGTLKCPICGSGKLVFGTKAFNEDLEKLTGAAMGAASGPVGALLGKVTGGLHRHKMVLEVGCVECGLIESLQDWKTAKPFEESKPRSYLPGHPIGCPCRDCLQASKVKENDGQR